MSKHKTKSLSVNHRETLLLLRRTTSFLLVFSVILVVILIFFSAVQNQNSNCQDRASEVVHDNLLKPETRFEDIVSVMTGVLSKYKAELSEVEKGAEDENKTIEWLDTGDGTMGANGFRLFRRTKNDLYAFELRAMFDKLCDAYPSLSMEVMPNVDYEKIQYKIRAVVFNNATRKFIFESSLLTKEKNRLMTFAQVQNVFPGFNQITTSKGTLGVLKTYEYTTVGAFDVYGGKSPLDITISVEQWSAKDSSNPLMWRVLVSTSNLLAENNIEGLQSKLRKAFEENNMLCGGTQCDNLLNGFLR
ncbi:hypothetical protein AGDE_00615 [Angomonas deanei]|uniref:Uncharacterized protein n=1 Tax=Angomonas deanei TaxID=59799 RepID=S9VKI7_9TRYP|nr:hypothetical protein AGDE_04838 [Angomonas deanei]EPY43307.1 hypothetical protein AGDE_00615 [Angomonas deanei]CAD2214809.1 hypothetical protein, conserved [Angomonas deanei]|eukprot:EPY39091.1 hypothetical protein AGDE_04838 [Angomonas deanei]